MITDVETDALRVSTPASGSVPPPVPVRRSRRFRLVVASEWIKLRSVRSTLFAVMAVVIGTIGIAALVCGVTAARWDHMGLRDRLDLQPTDLSLNGWFLAQLGVGVLGVLAVTSEYGSRMIRTTFAAVPRRREVLVAKALVVATVVLITGVATAVSAFLLGQALLSSTGHAASLQDPGVLRAVVGAGLYATVIALLGVGLGALVRSTAGAISALFGALFVPPILAEAFTGSWHRTIQKFSPMNAGSRILTVRPSVDALGPWAGLGVLALYTAAVLALAVWLVSHRDA